MELILYEFDDKKMLYAGYFKGANQEVVYWDANGKSLNGKRDLTINEITLFWNNTFN